MASIKDDIIKVIMTGDASQLQQEIHKIEKSTQSLKEENKAYKKQMTELVAAGKANSGKGNNALYSMDEAVRKKEEMEKQTKR